MRRVLVTFPHVWAGLYWGIVASSMSLKRDNDDRLANHDGVSIVDLQRRIRNEVLDNLDEELELEHDDDASGDRKNFRDESSALFP